ncbi:MAG: universal stress protein [Chloroflexota bacterium]
MIVCATRGGEASLAAQDYAIKLAQDTNQELVFLCVTDTHVLAGTSDTRPHDIAHDLTRMSEFILCIAEDRARDAGLENVRWVCHLGNAREEIQRFVTDSGASVLVLGRPALEGDEQRFSYGELESFARYLESELDLKVYFVEPTADDLTPSDDRLTSNDSVSTEDSVSPVENDD